MRRPVFGLADLPLLVAVSLMAALAFGQGTERAKVLASQEAIVCTRADWIASITALGTVPGPFILGTYVSGGSGLTGTSSPDAWASTTDAVFDPAAADALDHRWIQVTTTPVIWDLGSPSRSVLVFPSIAQGLTDPAPHEALGFTVWGSNDPTAPFPGSWTLAEFTEIYADGWISVGAKQESDDFASSWTFGAEAFQFIAVYANRSVEILLEGPEADQCLGQKLWCSPQCEIDAVGMPTMPVDIEP